MGGLTFKALKLQYELEVTGLHVYSVLYQGRDLVDKLRPHLTKSQIVIGDPFNGFSRDIKFVPEVANICNDVLNSIKQIKATRGNIIGLANIADYLFQAFTPDWRDNLLKLGLDTIGITFWKNISSIIEV